MTKLKKFLSVLLTIIVFSTVFVMPTTVASAKAKANIPKRVTGIKYELRENGALISWKAQKGCSYRVSILGFFLTTDEKGKTVYQKDPNDSSRIMGGFLNYSTKKNKLYTKLQKNVKYKIIVKAVKNGKCSKNPKKIPKFVYQGIIGPQQSTVISGDSNTVSMIINNITPKSGNRLLDYTYLWPLAKFAIGNTAFYWQYNKRSDLTPKKLITDYIKSNKAVFKKWLKKLEKNGFKKATKYYKKYGLKGLCTRLNKYNVETSNIGNKIFSYSNKYISNNLDVSFYTFLPI